MVVNKKVDGIKDFISYLDDDGTTKNQHIIIISKDDFCVEFKFDKDDIQTISIPWHRVLKIKEKGDENG